MLVPISGESIRYGRWEHVAFVPAALPLESPALSASTFNAVADARAAVAALDSSARRLPNPALLRRPVLRREAQSTSALEGTYAPLPVVLAADEREDQTDAGLREVINYVRAAEHAFAWHGEGRPFGMTLLTELHAALVRGTSVDGDQTGRLRSNQVMVGGDPGMRVQDARFVPRPPGPELEQQVRTWIDWFTRSRDADIDPVVAAGMSHYHFETLHPFHDGNGRIGRLLIVLQLLYAGVLVEPTLTVSPWFEARRADYYDALMAVSTRADWDGWIRFFARGVAAAARDTEQRLVELLAVQDDLKRRVRAGGLRADNATLLVDFALGRPIFTVRQVQEQLGVTYTRANGLVGQLVELGVLRRYDESAYAREFTAPDIVAILLRA
ncbi:Fic family protein [Pseudonocardia kongjuensis]